MNASQKIIAGTASVAVLAMGDLRAAQAEDLVLGWKTMKPLYALSFNVGRKHVLSYFLKKRGQCDLTMMVTDQNDTVGDDKAMPTLSTARIKAEITSGKTASFGLDATTGRSLEYACSSDAQAMSVRQTDPVAKTDQRPLYPYRFNRTKLLAAGLGG